MPDEATKYLVYNYQVQQQRAIEDMERWISREPRCGNPECRVLRHSATDWSVLHVAGCEVKLEEVLEQSRRGR
jgi:hypothetical protein